MIGIDLMSGKQILLDEKDLEHKNAIQFNTSAGISVGVGQMAWNSDEQTIDLGLNSDVTLQIGQEMPVLCKNQTGATITNGTPVMFAGSVGASGRLKIMKAIADGTYLPAYTIGIATQDIPNGEDGFVTWFGKIRGIDTTGTPYGETWADGDILYVSPTTAGYLTNVLPEAPNEIITVGVVIYADANVGSLFVRPTWRQSLQTLTDVDGTPLATTGQTIYWDNTNKYFDFTTSLLLNDADKAGFTGSMFIGNGGTKLSHVTDLDAYYNVGMGVDVLKEVTTGRVNVAMGYKAMRDLTTGVGNFALGHSSMVLSTSANYNVGIGSYTLQGCKTGINNIAIGYAVLSANPSGDTISNNVGVGYRALYTCTGNYNTAIGSQALDRGVAMSSGTAIGYQSQLYVNDTSTAWTNYDLSIGYQALIGSTTPANNPGNNNTANGTQTLYSNTSGSANMALGYRALYSLVGSHNDNVAIGANAGRYYNGSSSNVLTIADACIFLGSSAYALADGDANEIVIGYCTTGNGSNTVTLGNSSITDQYFTGNGHFTGRVTEQGTFAEIYVADATASQAIATGTTYTKLTTFTTNGQSSNCTSDATNDKITVTKTGRYLVTCSINASSGTANSTFKFAAFLNGVEQSNIHAHRKYAAAGDNGSCSISGIIDVTTANWDLDIRARHDVGSSVDLTTTYMNLKVIYLGET